MSRGLLRIYLGAAPGVGKTFAMLDEGWRRKERGADVVIGLAVTHDRPKTIAQLRDLEVVPCRKIEYRGQVFEEMDLDAVLARRPEVVLVDELAHTNIPGSVHAKRWQDVEVLLDAGITVISTINIQHLESLNDVVERITGVTQRETVPDSVVRAAAQIELVDMDPEALRRRMAHGNIYGPDKVDDALNHYFRAGNLAALRELALLWVADRVDEALHDYRERHGITDTWETKERVIVALTGAPGGETLIRRAARMTVRLKADLIGVHVQSSDGLTTPSTEALQSHRELLEEFGGTYQEVASNDVAKALVQIARSENATQLLIGASKRSRWADLTRGSVVNAVVREASGALDIHVISSDREQPAQGLRDLRSPPRLRLAPLSERRRFIAFALAGVGLPVLTAVLAQFRSSLDLQDVLLCYLLLIVAVATIGGAVPAGIASIAGFLLLNWFFATPVHTFSISNGRDVLALIVFLVIAAVISALVDLAARRRSDAYRARIEARSLARMAGLVLRKEDPMPELLADLVAAFRLEGAAVLRVGKDGWTAETRAGHHPPSSPAEGTLAVPLSSGVSLVLRGTDLRAEDREALNGFANHLAVALEGRQLQAEAANASALAKANELRTALLAAVSHDLRTPLASIKTAATSLLDDDVSWSATAVHELLRTVDEEADRLNTLVGNLLDMSRLQTGGLVMHARAVGLEEVVAAALRSIPTPQRVDVQISDTLPPVMVDPGLLERAAANLITNALAFSPEGEKVRVEVRESEDRVDLWVIDHGRGIAPEQRDRVFRAFQRLDDSPNGSGVGLGLAVAKGFVEAMDGTITIADTPTGGCTMIVSLRAAKW